MMSKLRFCWKNFDLILIALGCAALVWGIYPVIR